MANETAGFTETDAAILVSKDVASILGTAPPPPVPLLTNSDGTYYRFRLDVSTNRGFWTVNGSRQAALASSASQDLPLMTVSVRSMIRGCLIWHTAQFTGTGLSAAQITAGVDADKAALVTVPPAYDPTVPVGSVAAHSVGRVFVAEANTVLSAYIATVGANVSVLAAGVVVIDLIVMPLP